MVGGGARQTCGFDIDLVGQLLQPVVGLAEAGGVECVGFDEVGAGLVILPVDVADDVRSGEYQQVVVAAQFVRMLAQALAAEIVLAQAVAR